jgi:transcription elongation GreA/GreB family factor
MAVNAANFYSAIQEERAAAQRACGVLRKLLRNASEIEGAATPEESLLIGQWMDSRHSQVESEDEYRATNAGKDPEFG